MEKYFQRMDPQRAGDMKAQRVLELNPQSSAFAALKSAMAQDTEKAKVYAELLYDQALLIAGLPLEDTARYTELVCSLMGRFGQNFHPRKTSFIDELAILPNFEAFLVTKTGFQTGGTSFHSPYAVL